MNHEEMGKIHESRDESIQPPLFPLGKRRDRSMHYSIFRWRNVGKEYAFVSHDSFDYYFYSFTMYMQVIAPKRSVIPYKLHGQIWATNIFEHGHSLIGKREILFHDGCFPKAPNISHTFSHGEMTCEASKWWGNQLPHVDLM